MAVIDGYLCPKIIMNFTRCRSKYIEQLTSRMSCSIFLWTFTLFVRRSSKCWRMIPDFLLRRLPGWSQGYKTEHYCFCLLSDFSQCQFKDPFKQKCLGLTATIPFKQKCLGQTATTIHRVIICNNNFQRIKIQSLLEISGENSFFFFTGSFTNDWAAVDLFL